MFIYLYSGRFYSCRFYLFVFLVSISIYIYIHLFYPSFLCFFPLLFFAFSPFFFPFFFFLPFLFAFSFCFIYIQIIFFFIIEFLYSNLILPTNLRLFFVFGSPLLSSSPPPYPPLSLSSSPPPLLPSSPLPPLPYLLYTRKLANPQSTLIRKTKLRNPKHILVLTRTLLVHIHCIHTVT